ncbi:MAG: plastocyanin/azurin family copper-binding protein [Aquihabitans sp.]
MKPTRSLVALGFTATLMLASCGTSDNKADDKPTTTTEAAGGSAAAAGDGVTIADFSFDPTPLQVKAGATVTFTNKDKETHTATSTGKVPADFDTGKLKKGDSKKVTFDEAGTYTYYCDIHNYMKGEVVVK